MKLRQFSLEYDAKFGINKRAGWSVTVNGSVVAEFCPTIEEALILALENVGDWDPEESP